MSLPVLRWSFEFLPCSSLRTLSQSAGTTGERAKTVPSLHPGRRSLELNGECNFEQAGSLADDLSRPLWDAAKERRLAIQRCGSCGYYNHPPRRFCDACLAQDLRFE